MSGFDAAGEVRTHQDGEIALVLQRAVADVGKPYLPAIANCEHDVTTIHSGGRPYSPMLQSVVVGIVIDVLLLVKFSKRLGLR